MKYWFIALSVMSLVLFIMMGVDKAKARKGAWRIPEKTLFILALLLGAVGGTIGMYVFRHKTKHWYFAVGFPLIAVVQIALILGFNLGWFVK